MPRIERSPPSACLLGELSSATARIAAHDDPSRELMRLAEDPLLLHAFLARRDDARHPALPRQKRELVLPASDASRHSVRQSSHLFAYRMASAPDPPSLWPEAYCPPEGDWLASLTCPEDTPVRRLRPFGSWVAVAVAALVISVLLVFRF